MTPLDDRKRQRGLALGLLAVFGGLLWLIAAAPLLSLFSDQTTRLEQTVARLAAYETRRSQIPLLEKRLAALEARGTSSSGLLTGGTAPLAAVSIQARLRPLLDRYGAQIRSVQNLPPVTGDGFEQIPVQYTFTLPQDGLRDLLYAIETAKPYLFLTDVSIRRPEHSSGADDAAAPLEIRLNVAGYRWVGGK